MIFDAQEYAMLWVAYLVSAVVLIGFGWYVSRCISWPLIRYLLRMVWVLSLVMPTLLDVNQGVWAPALISAWFEWLTAGQSAALATLKPLLWGIGMGTACIMAQWLIQQWRIRLN